MSHNDATRRRNRFKAMRITLAKMSRIRLMRRDELRYVPVSNDSITAAAKFTPKRDRLLK
jgi:hypothetical protein